MKMERFRDRGIDFEEKFSEISHLAVSVGSKQAVDELTEAIRENGFTVMSNPRPTGDGY
jgi:lactoylglutathione lyase